MILMTMTSQWRYDSIDRPDQPMTVLNNGQWQTINGQYNQWPMAIINCVWNDYYYWPMTNCD